MTLGSAAVASTGFTSAYRPTPCWGSPRSKTAPFCIRRRCSRASVKMKHVCPHRNSGPSNAGSHTRPCGAHRYISKGVTGSLRMPRMLLPRLRVISGHIAESRSCERDWRVVPMSDSGSAASKSIISCAALSRRLFPRRCEELQCDSRKAIFSAANKAEAVNAERNLLVWNGIFMALFLGTLQVT